MDNNTTTICEENNLLSVKLVSTRNYGLTKKNVDELMEKYEEYKYKYHQIKPPEITQKFEIRYEQFVICNSDKVGNFVVNKIDLLEKVDKFYFDLKQAMKTLTMSELSYWRCYVNGISEEAMCQRMLTNRCSLERIKKSCIIKIAMYFDIDVKTT